MITANGLPDGSPEALGWRNEECDSIPQIHLVGPPDWTIEKLMGVEAQTVERSRFPEFVEVWIVGFKKLEGRITSNIQKGSAYKRVFRKPIGGSEDLQGKLRLFAYGQFSAVQGSSNC